MSSYVMYTRLGIVLENQTKCNKKIKLDFV